MFNNQIKVYVFILLAFLSCKDSSINDYANCNSKLIKQIYFEKDSIIKNAKYYSEELNFKDKQLELKNSHLIFENFKIPKKFTFSFWFKPSDIINRDYLPIITKSIDGTKTKPYYQFSFVYRGKNHPGIPYVFEFWGGFGNKLYSLSSLIRWKPEKWYHLSVTYDTKKLTFYVNGKHQTSKIIIDSLIKSKEPIHIGKHFYDEKFTSGAIKNFKLFKISLTRKQIKTLYNNSL